MSLNDALEVHRPIYAIGSDMPVGDDEVISLIEKAAALVPNAFNVKSQRVLVMLGERNAALWDAMCDASVCVRFCHPPAPRRICHHRRRP